MAQFGQRAWFGTRRSQVQILSPRCVLYIISGCSVVWLARLVWDQEVAGSNPATPIFFMKVVNQLVSVAQPDRATAF